MQSHVLSCELQGLEEFSASLNDVIWGRWYAEQEVATIVRVAEKGDSDCLFSLVAEWAGELVEVRKRRHRHRAEDECWCEYGESEYEPVGGPRAQQRRLRA